MRVNSRGSRPQPAPIVPISSSTSTSITTFRTGTYNTGRENPAVESVGIEDGTMGVLNSEIVGENAEPHFLSQLTGEHAAARHVIGHAMRAVVQSVAAVLSVLKPNIKFEREAALSAIDAHKSALMRQLVKKAEFAASGMTLAPKASSWLFALKLLALFAGDWTLIAVGFQLFGLSDHPWIPGVGFTDDLHIAAISSVAALVFLGDRAGAHLSGIVHHLKLRGRTPKAERAELPGQPWHDWALLGLWLGTAIAALVALANIRNEYLTQNGIDANGAAFIALQMGIFGAALAIAYAHAPDPEIEQWRTQLDDVEAEVKTTGGLQKASLDTYSASIGRFNTEVCHLDAEVAQSGHHEGTDKFSVIAQKFAYLRRYLLSQPGDQIATQSILTHEFEQIPDDTKEELLEFLTGITPLPRFTLLTTKTVEQALANARGEVSRLRSRIDLKGINALELPAFVALGDEQVGSDEDEGSDPDEMPETDVDGEDIERDADEAAAQTTAEGVTPQPLHPIRTRASVGSAENATEAESA